jgi:sugar/nucleoside kinase (ribokinase family)
LAEADGESLGVIYEGFCASPAAHCQRSLYQTSYEEALEQLRNDCEFGAVTRDKRGSVVINGHDLVRIEPEPVDWVIDATGAGDQYAAGFLYGFTRGMAIEHCGQLGSMSASEVITHVGPRPLV